jgi:hypothetical protein
VISKVQHIPVPLLLLMVGVGVDSFVNCARPARVVRVEFESWRDEYAVSKCFWRHVKKKCDLCLEEFGFDDHDELRYSIAIDSTGINFLHRSCAATLDPLAMRVVIEGYQYPDTQHYLSVNYRGHAPRLVIGNTGSVTRGALLQVMQEIVDGRMVMCPMTDGKTLIQ